MAVKKAVAKTRKKRTSKGKTKVGDAYVCEVCGLAVTVDEECGCVQTCDILCCQKPMKKKRAKK